MSAMNTTWALGVVAAGTQDVQPLAGGVEESVTAAREAAGDALVLAALGRGRQQFRLRLAGTDLMVLPGSSEDGRVEVDSLYDAVWTLRENMNPATNPPWAGTP